MNNKDAFYFGHDANARNDLRMVAVRRRFGMAGYGAYWAIIEILREQYKYKLPAKQLEDVEYEFRYDDFKAFIDFCVENGLFVIEDDLFFSPALLRRMKEWDDAKDRRSAAGKKAVNARYTKEKQEDSERSTNVVRTYNGRSTDVYQERKGKEKKGKEIKERKECEPGVYLTDEEHEKLTTEFGKKNVERILASMASWQVEHKPYKDHYLAARNWLKKEGAEPPAKLVEAQVPEWALEAARAKYK